MQFAKNRRYNPPHEPTNLSPNICGNCSCTSLPVRASPPPHKIAKVGVQLYTVREAMKTDFDGTIARSHRSAYKELEFAGYFGHSPKEIRECSISTA